MAGTFKDRIGTKRFHFLRNRVISPGRWRSSTSSGHALQVEETMPKPTASSQAKGWITTGCIRLMCQESCLAAGNAQTRNARKHKKHTRSHRADDEKTKAADAEKSKQKQPPLHPITITINMYQHKSSTCKLKRYRCGCCGPNEGQHRH